AIAVASLATYSAPSGTESAKVLTAGPATLPKNEAVSGPRVTVPGPGGGIVFQSATGMASVVTSAAFVADLGLPMATGTSPAVSPLPSGGVEIAYQGVNGSLVTVAPSGAVTDTHQAMATGTSPGVVGTPSGPLVAYQASNGMLTVLSPAGAALPLG